jgi:menaquinone-dependent protoporphyrinogen oxidase
MSEPRVLVTYGTERGATAEIASAIAETLRGEGLDVALVNARDIERIDDYDAVIIGSALYLGHWHRDARRLVKRHAAALRDRTVYMFSSGPLDTSASERDLPPPTSVARLVHSAGAVSHVTFGGRLARDAEGFIAGKMAEKLSGDWRSWHQIRAWAREVAGALKTLPVRAAPVVGTQVSGRWLLAALCFFVGITAIGGGATLIARPDGSLLEMPQTILERSPFESFLIPGFILFFVIGIGSIVAGALVSRDTRSANHAAFAAGAALLGWMVAEMAMLHSMRWLQLSYLVVAALIMLEAYRRRSRSSGQPLAHGSVGDA